MTFISCEGNKQPIENSDIHNDTVKPTIARKKEKIKIDDYMSNDHYFHWIARHPDTTQYMCEITLHGQYAIYWYHGQCQYYYFTDKTGNNTIELLWSYKTDCILNMDFLEKSNGIKNFPKCGDTFATYTLVNDTVLKVKYDFPDWARKINEIAKDSIFPTFFYFDKNSSI